MPAAQAAHVHARTRQLRTHEPHTRQAALILSRPSGPVARRPAGHRHGADSEPQTPRPLPAAASASPRCFIRSSRGGQVLRCLREGPRGEATLDATQLLRREGSGGLAHHVTAARGVQKPRGAGDLGRGRAVAHAAAVREQHRDDARVAARLRRLKRGAAIAAHD